MKVRHFLGSLNPKYGGPTLSVPIQCVGVANKGMDVTFTTYSESRPYENNLIASGVHIDEYEKSRSKIGRFFSLSLRKLLKKRNDIDIYHIHGVWRPGCHWIASAARSQNKKYVINPRGDLELYRINYNKWKKIKKMIVWHLYVKKDVQNASCIIATSKQEMDAIRSLGITSPIAIIPNGLDLSVFPKVSDRIPHDKKVVLFLSRVNPIKGLELLLDAWSQLSYELRNQWELHIVGNSDPIEYVDSLFAKIDVLGINDSVKILGPITGLDKIRKYENSDLFILPTFNENFGNVIAEAMMCECPVITTKNAPWSCLVEDKCGWWIDLSVQNLVETLTAAMTLSDEERQYLGHKGRNCIIERFDKDKVADMTIKVYEWVMGLADKPEFVHTIIR